MVQPGVERAMKPGAGLQASEDLMDVSKLPDVLIDAAISHTLVPLVGAGVSRHALTDEANSFPTWPQFLTQLMRVAMEEEVLNTDTANEIHSLVQQHQFLLAAEVVKGALPPDRYHREIRSAFNPSDAKPGELHVAILALGAPIILTTNYDRLLEQAYLDRYHKEPLSHDYHRAEMLHHYIRTPPPSRPKSKIGAHKKPQAPFIFKMHGDVNTPAEIILTEKDYRKLMMSSEASHYRKVLEAVFSGNTVMMLGFSGEDPELTMLFRTMNETFFLERTPDFLLLPAGKKGPVERELYRKFFSIDVVEYNAVESHAELTEVVSYLAFRANEVP